MTQEMTFPIFDGHNDVLMHLHFPERGGRRTFFDRSDEGHLDLPRAREGGFAGGFFAVYVPSEAYLERLRKPEEEREEREEPPEAVPALDPHYAQRTAIDVTATLFRVEAASEGQVRIVRTVEELEACLDDGVLAAIFHFEGTEPIDPDLNALHVFHQAGLRSLGIAWSRPNAFGHGVPFKFPGSPDQGPGLTDAGRELVRACNELGVMLDLSHLNEKGFWDVAETSDAPLVATHSNAHALCPTPRNLTDAQLDAVGESGGVVGLNFAVGFLREDGERDADTPLTEIVRHADYIAERIGVDYVALGSDFDGATIPRQLGDAAGLPKLIDAFREAGFDEASLRKLTHENWLRLLRQTWR